MFRKKIHHGKQTMHPLGEVERWREHLVSGDWKLSRFYPWRYV